MDLPVTTPTLKSLKGIELGRQLAWIVSASKDRDYQVCRNVVKNFYSGSRAIADPQVLESVKQLPPIADMIYDHHILNKFENSFGAWILAHGSNTLQGLENFEPDISQGSTQAFDSFFLKHAAREICFFQGEYFYHILSCTKLQRPWQSITHVDQLATNSALIISVPFCDTGNQPDNLQQILEVCDHLGVPVLLDCSYYTIANHLHIDLRHPCIDTVAFSLSKTFPIAHARVGMRYTRPCWQDGQKLHKNINYNNRLTAGVGLYIIQQYASDYVVNKYKESYDYLVELLDLTPSNSVMFADGNDSWQEYGRKSLMEVYGLDLDFRLFRNRICLTHLLENIDLVKTLTC
jgi:hypothetical protein